MQRLFLCAALCAQEKCGAVAPIFLDRGGFVTQREVSAPEECRSLSHQRNGGKPGGYLQGVKTALACPMHQRHCGWMLSM
jgi:hypothetical protein